MHPNAPRGMIESLIGEAVDVVVHIANVRFKQIARENSGAEENKGDTPPFYVHWQKEVLRSR
jgi:hypothetical protein